MIEEYKIDAMFDWLKSESETNPLALVALDFIKNIQIENSEIEDFYINGIEFWRAKKLKRMDS